MVKVVVGDERGLVQSAGSGTIINNRLFERGAALNVGNQQAQATTANSTAAVTAANIATGIVQCTPTTARAKDTDTAANLISTLGLTVDNDSVDFAFINLATDGSSAVTLSGGANVTLVGSGVIQAQDAAADAFSSGAALFRIRRTSATAVTLYRLS